MTSRTRTEAVCLAASTRFDWDEWNARMDAGMSALREIDRVEREMHDAHSAMIRDVRAIIQGEME